MTDRVSADRGAAVHLSEDPARVRISATTLGDLLLTAYDRAPDKEALVFPEGRKTYAALVEAQVCGTGPSRGQPCVRASR